MIDYELERLNAAKRLNMRVAAIDKFVDEHRTTEASVESGGAGRPIDISDIEPWAFAVDGAALLDELSRTIRRYVVVDEATADAIALWVIHTHAIDAAYISPRLAITSPEKRCGKTTLLAVIAVLVARALSAANVTPATVFRVIEATQPTLLIDEADTFFGDNGHLRGIINAGWCQASATVLRTVETRDDHEVRGFSVWGAVAIAAIGALPGTIEDRSIKVALRRRRPDEHVERVRLDRLDLLRPLSQRAARWVTDNLETLGQADRDVPSELHDRAADNWRPLLAIADSAGGDWPQRARRAAVSLCREGAEDSGSVRTMLLADLREMFASEQSGVLFTAEILRQLCDRDDRPWPEYKRGKPITPTQLAAILKPLKISSGTVRRGEHTMKGYQAAQFADAWQRYLPPPSASGGSAVTTSQPAASLALPAPTPVTTAKAVTAAKAPNAAETATCDVVTGGGPSYWHERV